MEINKLVVSTLAPLGIVTAFQSYNGTADKHIMYSVYDENEGAVYDDEATEIQHYIQLGYWCEKPQDLAVYQQIKQLMKKAGFKFDGAQDRFNDESGKYGKNIDFIYTEYL